MWIEPYDRLNVPEGLHSGWGDHTPMARLTDPRTLTPFSRTITELPDRTLPGSGIVFSPEGDEIARPSFLAQAAPCRFRTCATEPFSGTSFLPDSALFVNDAQGRPEAILEESLWHTNLFFSPHARNDASTNWQWLVRGGWTADETISEPVNHAFHIFGYQYFHWLIDALPRIWALQGAPHAKGRRWYVGPADQPFHLPSLALFDIGPEDCIAPQGPVTTFADMTYAAFLFEEPLRVRPSYSDGRHYKGWSPEYLAELRDRAWTRFGITARGGRRLYLSRRTAGHRRILNEDAVSAVLDRFGFEACDPSALSFEDQCRLFAQADVVAGAHGAGLTNIVWSPPGATVMEFMPETIQDPGYRFISDMVGHAHHVLLCPEFEHPLGPAYADIKVDCPALETLLRRSL
jgi:hypothetical protein